MAQPSELERHIEQQKIRLFLKQVRSGAVVNSIIALTLIYLLKDKLPMMTQITWLTVMFLFSLYRFGVAPNSKQLASMELEELRHSLKIYLPGLAGTGLCWLVTAWALYIPGSWEEQSILAMMILGAITGAVPMMSPLIRVMNVYAAACVLPTGLRLIWEGHNPHMAFGILGLLMLAMFWRSAGLMHKSLDLSLRNTFKNDELIDNLEDAIVKAEEASRVKSEFLANISHEIRTPMHAVIGFGEYLIETNLNQEQYESLAIMNNSAQHLLSLINDILDFSKIESGQIKIDLQEFDLKEELKKLLLPFELQAEEKGLKMVFDYDDSCPPWVEADLLRLKQVLTNLLGNALKFTEKGFIRLGVKLLDQQDRQARLLFQIEDSGIGIPPNKLQAIFNSFEQADSSLNRKFGGTGLGLSISQKLVLLMGGRIDVESTKGERTLFTVELPLTVPPTSFLPHKLRERVQPPDFSEYIILLVEDNIFNQKVALMALEKMHPKEVLVANSREKALEILKKEDIAALLLDMQMPELDSLKMARQIRSRAAGCLNPMVPIIAMTANALESDRKACMEAGMNDYISKPLHLDDLFLIFQRLLKAASS